MEQSKQSEASILKSNLQPNEKHKSEIVQSIQNGQQTRFKFQKVFLLDYCLLTFSITSIFLSMVYYEADYVGKYQISVNTLILMNIAAFPQILVTIMRYNSQIQLQKSQKILQQGQNIYSSGKLPYIIMQIIISLVMPYHFLADVEIVTRNVYDEFEFNYKVNYILVVLGFLKIYVVMRVVLQHQIYMSPRSSRLCRMYGSQPNYLYAIKCLFKDSPLFLIGIVFGSSMIIFTIALRIAQRNLVVEYPKHFDGVPYPANIQKFQNAVWLAIITMTTVGFGDFFPRTLFGRAIDVILVIWGTFIVSLMVVVLTNTLNMDQAEKRALIVLNRLQAKKGLKEAAAFLITHSCRTYLMKKRKKQIRQKMTDIQTQKMQNKFYKYLSSFQNLQRSIRSMYQIDDVYQQMTRQFQVINDEVNALLTSQKQTIINLSKNGNSSQFEPKIDAKDSYNLNLYHR